MESVKIIVDITVIIIVIRICFWFTWLQFLQYR